MKVIDASALAAIVFEEPESDAVHELIGASPACAPRLIGYELAQVAIKKSRKSPDKAIQYRDQLARFLSTPPVLFDVDWLAAHDLARSSGLSAYDACYLWLAKATSAELVTLDRRLAEAARALP